MGVASEFVAHLRGLFDLNETLATTIPSALGKEPALRGPFDTIAIQHVEEDMEKRMTEWKARIRDAEAVKADHVEKVRTACEALQAAQKRQVVSADTFIAARTEKEETEKLLEEARKKLEAIPTAQHKTEKKL